MTSPSQEPATSLGPRHPQPKRAVLSPGLRVDEREAPLPQLKPVIHLRYADNGSWIRILSFDENQALEETFQSLGVSSGACGKVFRPPTSNGALLIDTGHCWLVIGRAVAQSILVEVLG